jgi:hypothetical protein
MRLKALSLDSSQEFGGCPVVKNGRKSFRLRRHDRESTSAFSAEDWRQPLKSSDRNGVQPDVRWTAI